MIISRSVLLLVMFMVLCNYCQLWWSFNIDGNTAIVFRSLFLAWFPFKVISEGEKLWALEIIMNRQISSIQSGIR